MKGIRLRAFTLVEVLVVVGILVFLGFLVLPEITHNHHTEARRLKCKNNLRQFGAALQQYIDGPGGGTYYPYPTQDGNWVKPTGKTLARGQGFSGASFLASLYWSGVLTEPNIFICPYTADSNRNGNDLGTEPDEDGNRPGWNPRFEKPNGSHVSYASKAQWTMPRGEPLKVSAVPSDTVIASDDTDGPENHKDGFFVLYGDMHVEFINTKKVGSGDKGMVGREKPLDLIDN